MSLLFLVKIVLHMEALHHHTEINKFLCCPLSDPEVVVLILSVSLSLDGMFADGTSCIPASCFTLRLPAELQAEDVTMAELWLYKQLDGCQSENHTLIISESGEKLKHLTAHRTDSEGELFINKTVRTTLSSSL